MPDQPARSAPHAVFRQRLRSALRETRTSSWSAKCATWNHPFWPDRRRTGHLVFGTLHTVRGQTIDRIIDVFPGGGKRNGPRHAVRIAAAVISQTLLKTKDGRAASPRTRS